MENHQADLEVMSLRGLTAYRIVFNKMHDLIARKEMVETWGLQETECFFKPIRRELSQNHASNYLSLT